MSGRLTISPSLGCQAVASASSSHDRARWSRRNTSALQHKAQLTLLAVLAAWYRTLCGGLDQHWLPHAETGLPKLVALQRAPLDSVPQENSQLAKRTKGHCSIAKQEIVCTGSPKVDRHRGLWIMQLVVDKAKLARSWINRSVFPTPTRQFGITADISVAQALKLTRGAGRVR